MLPLRVWLKIDSLKKELNIVFEMKDLGSAKKIFGMEIKGTRRSLSWSCLRGVILRRF